MNLTAEYIDHLGDDLRVVNAARVSFDKESGQGFNDPEYSLSKLDVRLINYLAKHDHWAPFGHPQVAIRETVPIFVARQRFKHVVGFIYNEVSRRYVSSEPEFYRSKLWRSAPTDGAKQGSSGHLPQFENESCDKVLHESQKFALQTYSDLLKRGVAPEMARMVLPQSMMTSYYVTGSLAAWARAYNLRIDSHAQSEIRDLAVKWGEIANRYSLSRGEL